MPKEGKPVRLRDAQKMVDEWIGQFEEGYWPPLANLARLAEEVGELARELNDQYGPKTKKPGEPAGDIGLELADCLFVLITLATPLGFALKTAFPPPRAKSRHGAPDAWPPPRRPAENPPPCRPPAAALPPARPPGGGPPVG